MIVNNSACQVQGSPFMDRPVMFLKFLEIVGMLKKAASGVLALLPCSRTESTLRASKGLRPCWTNFFEQSLSLV